MSVAVSFGRAGVPAPPSACSSMLTQRPCGCSGVGGSSTSRPGECPTTSESKPRSLCGSATTRGSSPAGGRSYRNMRSSVGVTCSGNAAHGATYATYASAGRPRLRATSAIAPAVSAPAASHAPRTRARTDDGERAGVRHVRICFSPGMRE
jgi:hypothetical protein